MTDKEFHISAEWARRRPPRPFHPEDYDLWDAEDRAFFAFLAAHEGGFTLVFSDATVELDLDDLRYALQRLDAVLDALRAEAGSADMVFPDLGIDLYLHLVRRGGDVVVEPHAGATAPPEFAALEGRRIAVDSGRFRDEWLSLRERLRRAAAPGAVGPDR